MNSDNDVSQKSGSTHSMSGNDGSTVEVDRTEYLNGGTVVRDPEPDSERGFLEVEHICVGCGETIRTFEIFDDRKEESLNAQPIHDSAKCVQKAEEQQEAA